MQKNFITILFVFIGITSNSQQRDTSIFNNFPNVDSIQMTKPLVFLLSGDLGCGKTVFSRKIGYVLGVKEKITSPTFVIYNQYETLCPSDISLKKGDFILKF